MIARIWHGKTKASDAEAYTQFLKERAVPDYQNTAGFENLTFLRKIVENEAHFTLITYWENLAAIENFAGADLEKAKYYPEDTNFLLEFEEKVMHHQVFAKH